MYRRFLHGTQPTTPTFLTDVLSYFLNRRLNFRATFMQSTAEQQPWGHCPIPSDLHFRFFFLFKTALFGYFELSLVTSE
jgi:hypothetical protein